jgi:hypothetical protein
LIRSNGLSSLVDVGALEYAFIFQAPFADDEYAVHMSGDASVTFEVIGKTTEAITIRLKRPVPRTIEIRLSP